MGTPTDTADWHCSNEDSTLANSQLPWQLVACCPLRDLRTTPCSAQANVGQQHSGQHSSSPVLHSVHVYYIRTYIQRHKHTVSTAVNVEEAVGRCVARHEHVIIGPLTNVELFKYIQVYQVSKWNNFSNKAFRSYV